LIDTDFKNAIEKKYGLPIQKRGDCERLAEIIYEETGRSISYNTLRRIYGLARPVKVKRDTLDVLSNYLGFNSYYHFINASSQVVTWEKRLRLYENLSRFDKNELLLIIKLEVHKKSDFLFTLINISREYLWAKKIRELTKIYTSDIITTLQISYKQRLIIGNAVGVLLRNISLSQKEVDLLCKSTFYQTFIFEVFVDYSNLNNYYYNFINTLHKKRNYANALFIRCLLNIRAHLNMTPVSEIKLTEDEIIKLHPILRGRYFTNFMFGNSADTSTFYTLNRFVTEVDFAESFYEPMLVSLLNEDSAMQFWLILQFEGYSKYNPTIENHYSSLLKLTKTFYHANNNEQSEAKKIFQTISCDDFILSYQSFFTFFYHLIGYQLYNSVEMKIQLSKSLRDNPYKRLKVLYKKALKHPISED